MIKFEPFIELFKWFADRFGAKVIIGGGGIYALFYLADSDKLEGWIAAIGITLIVNVGRTRALSLVAAVDVGRTRALQFAKMAQERESRLAIEEAIRICGG